jgi:hypothetical protein
MIDQDRPCPHTETAAIVEVIHLEDSDRWQAQIHIWCAHCDEPFLWPAEIPVGVDLSGVARSLDGQELRIAILSAAEVMPG